MAPEEMSTEEMSIMDERRHEFRQASSTSRAAAHAHQARLATAEPELLAQIVTGLNAYIENNDTYIREEQVDERALLMIHAAEEAGMCSGTEPGTFNATKYIAQGKLDGDRSEIRNSRRVVSTPITYQKSQFGPLGRYFTKGSQSMQRCKGRIRAHLAEGLVDIDQVNAFPVIASQIFGMLGFEQPCFLE